MLVGQDESIASHREAAAFQTLPDRLQGLPLAKRLLRLFIRRQPWNDALTSIPNLRALSSFRRT